MISDFRSRIVCSIAPRNDTISLSSCGKLQTFVDKSILRASWQPTNTTFCCLLVDSGWETESDVTFYSEIKKNSQTTRNSSGRIFIWAFLTLPGDFNRNHQMWISRNATATTSWSTGFFSFFDSTPHYAMPPPQISGGNQITCPFTARDKTRWANDAANGLENLF